MKNLNRLFTLFVCLLTINLLAGCAGGAGATAKKAYDPTGIWEYSVQVPGGDSFGTMRITGSKGLFEAVLETDQFGTLDVKDFTVVDIAFSGTISVAGTTGDLEGAFEGEKMTGSVLLGAEVYPMAGTRKSK